ncbi:MAG: IS481 family transposase [Rhodosalinus sp.]
MSAEFGEWLSHEALPEVPDDAVDGDGLRSGEGDDAGDEPVAEGDDTTEQWAESLADVDSAPRLCGPRKGGTLSKPDRTRPRFYSPEQRVLLLDTWERSALPARDFAVLVGVSPHTLYAWRKKFEEFGPSGLMDKPRGAPGGSRLPEVTKRTILMLKKQHPQWGCQRISDMLLRGPALPASPNAVARVLKEAGYEYQELATHPHPDKKRRFERARPNQLWQTDLFTFVLKRQNRRVHLVGYLDDHSRFIVGFGLHGTQSAAMVIETLRSAIASYQPPREVLTDNGAQYVTWRGKSAFSKECEKLGIKQIVSRPKHPQTLGKIERFWGTLWRECLESAVFLDLDDARERIRHFVDYYNFQRPHQGIDGLTPADRYFEAAPEVLATMKQRVAANAVELARHGKPKKPFYITGQVDGRPFSVHAEGERVILRREDGQREEVDLVKPQEAQPVAQTPLPGVSALDDLPLLQDDVQVDEDDDLEEII